MIVHIKNNINVIDETVDFNKKLWQLVSIRPLEYIFRFNCLLDINKLNTTLLNKTLLTFVSPVNKSIDDLYICEICL